MKRRSEKQKEPDPVGNRKDKTKLSKVFLGRSLKIQRNCLLFCLTLAQEKCGSVYFFFSKQDCVKVPNCKISVPQKNPKP